MSVTRVSGHSSILERRRQCIRQCILYPDSSVNDMSLYRGSLRTWTLNRSPHGNKTARDQFGLGLCRSYALVNPNARQWITELRGPNELFILRRE